MFLFLTDYINTISNQDLNELLNGDPSMDGDQVRLKQEVWAQNRISSYIRQRYNVALVFAPWLPWSLSASYTIGQYFQYTENAFSTTSIYGLNARVSYNNAIYSCTTPVTTAGPFNSTNWTYVCDDLQIFTCIAASTNNYPDNTAYFSQSDPRDADVIKIMLHIVIYELNNLIVPAQIPEQRWINYNNKGNPRKGDGSAIGTLLGWQEGTLMAYLPIYQDEDMGQSVSWGSNLKRNNSY